MKNIDVVYLWCGLPENDKCSFTKDIHYSIKSVNNFIPFIRSIFIVVDDKVNEEHLLKTGIDIAQINIVHYKDIIPKKYLPILWNSNVIESWIWKITDLSENFIYFCDDMYVGKECTKDVFFFNDKPILRMHQGSPDHDKKLKNENDYVNMWLNAITAHDIHYTRQAHGCLPYKKSLLKKYYKQYKKEVHLASQNKIRSGKKDFNLLRFSGSLAVMNGESILITTDSIKYDYFVESNDKHNVKKILKIKPQFFCINNTHKNDKWVYNMLEDYYS